MAAVTNENSPAWAINTIQNANTKTLQVQSHLIGYTKY